MGVPGASGTDWDFDIVDAPPPPVADAVDDGPFDALEATAKLMNVGANDVNFTNPVTITHTTPAKGTAVVTTATGNAADVIITYTSNAGATGTDTFGYSITDGTAPRRLSPSMSSASVPTTIQPAPPAVCLLVPAIRPETMSVSHLIRSPVTPRVLHLR